MIAAISVGAWPHASDSVGNDNFDGFDRAASVASQVLRGVVVPVASYVTNHRNPANASESAGAVSSHAASEACHSDGSALHASQLRSYRR